MCTGSRPAGRPADKEAGSGGVGAAGPAGGGCRAGDTGVASAGPAASGGATAAVPVSGVRVNAVFRVPVCTALGSKAVRVVVAALVPVVVSGVLPRVGAAVGRACRERVGAVGAAGTVGAGGAAVVAVVPVLLAVGIVVVGAPSLVAVIVSVCAAGCHRVGGGGAGGGRGVAAGEWSGSRGRWRWRRRAGAGESRGVALAAGGGDGRVECFRAGGGTAVVRAGEGLWGRWPLRCRKGGLWRCWGRFL